MDTAQPEAGTPTPAGPAVRIPHSCNAEARQTFGSGLSNSMAEVGRFICAACWNLWLRYGRLRGSHVVGGVKLHERG